MATLTWKGGFDGNSATDPSNWVGDSLPQAGDTIIVNAGSLGGVVTLDLADTTLTDNTIEVAGPFDDINFDAVTLDGVNATLGAGAALNVTDSQTNVSNLTLDNNATLSLTGSGATTMELDESNQDSHSQSMIVQAGTAAVVDINGTVDNQGFFLADKAGGTLTLNIAQNGSSEPGLYLNQGPIIDIGETVDITTDSNSGTKFANNGFIYINGESAPASVVLSAAMTSVTGGFDLVGSTNGATLEIDTNVSGTQNIIFGDGNGLLKIDATNLVPNSTSIDVLEDFFARIAGFQSGDTIELAGISSTGLSWSYGNNPTYGDNVLDLVQNGTTIALLRISGQFVDGSGSTGGTNDTNFVISGSGGNTFITLQSQNAVSGGTTVAVTGTLASFTGATPGGTIDWGTAAAWTGGSGSGGIPGQYQSAEFNLIGNEVTDFLSGTEPKYQVNVSSAETVGGVVFSDPFATLDIAAALTLAVPPGQSGGGQFSATQGTVEISDGGLLTTTRFYEGEGGKLTIDPGGSLAASGVPSFATGGGLSGIDIEQDATIEGTLTSGGYFTIGQNDTGSVTLEAGGQVTDTYAAVGGQAAVNPFGTMDSAYLDITGAGTVWKDEGGDSTTPYSGAMLVGGGLPSTGSVSNSTTASVGTGGTGYLQVDMGATLEDSSFAILGVRTGAVGGVTVSNNAQWDIDTSGGVPLSATGGELVVGTSTLQGSELPVLTVGLGGSGNLDITSGGTVALATSTASGGYKMTIGEGGPTDVTANGYVNVDDGLLNTNGGPLDLGLYGSGTLNVTDGGTVEVTSWGTINYGIVLGRDQVNSSSLSSGTLMVGGGNGTSLLTDNGDFDDGRDGNGNVQVSSGGSIHASGTLYLGGNGSTISLGSGVFNVFTGGTASVGAVTIYSGTLLAGGLVSVGGNFVVNDGTNADSQFTSAQATVESGGSLHTTGTLFVGGKGTIAADSGNVFSVNGGTASVAALKIWQGDTVSLIGQSNLSVGNFGAPTAGQLDVATGATLQGAGLVTVSSNSSDIINNGTVLASMPGATLELNAVLDSSSGVYQVGGGGIVGAIMRVDDMVDSGATFSLGDVGADSTLELESPINFNGTIYNFWGGTGADTLDLPTLTFSTANPQVTYVPDANPTFGGTIEISSTANDYSFIVTGYHPGGFSVHVDSGTGTAIVADDAAPCFAAGTQILTAAGERVVETLRPGDTVPTLLGGGLRRVRWVGQTRVDLHRHPRPEKVAPIRVRAHAFGPGMPHRDLLLSPDHAVALDGALVPIHLLVNGASIVREPAEGVVTYVHVELDSHDVLLAEGLPAESYLDTGNRGLFAGTDAARPLHPDLCADLSARAWDERSCAPLLLGGSLVLAAHRRLAARATVLGHRLTDDPALRITADGVTLAAEATAPGVIRVRLPAGTRDIRLLSRSVVPQELDRGSDDRRRLGVALTGLCHDGRALALHDAGFVAGFHAIEQGGEGGDFRRWRWTDGAATLCLPPKSRPSVLELRLIPGWRRYHDTAPPAVSGSAVA